MTHFKPGAHIYIYECVQQNTEFVELSNCLTSSSYYFFTICTTSSWCNVCAKPTRWGEYFADVPHTNAYLNCSLIDRWTAWQQCSTVAPFRRIMPSSSARFGFSPGFFVKTRIMLSDSHMRSFKYSRFSLSVHEMTTEFGVLAMRS